jgi:DNA repair protein RecN (Recombination protein N)
MLRQIAITNLAVISDVSLTLGPGLTVVTGETGSGKSMLVRALRMACALEGDARWIGPDGASAVVDVELDGIGGPLHDDEAGALSVTCRLGGAGRRYSSWGHPVAAQLVREQLDGQVRFVRQGETALLRSGPSQRAWLDGWSGHAHQMEAVGSAWTQIQQAKDQRSGLLAQQERVDFERFSAQEVIERTGRVDLDEAVYARVIEHEQLVLGNANLGEDVQLLLAALDSDEGPWAQLMDLDRRAHRLPDQISEAWSAMLEAHQLLVSHLADVQAELPELDVDQVLADAAVWKALLRRHGPQVSDAVAAREQALSQMEQLDELPELIEQAESLVADAQGIYASRAAELTISRKASAERLAKTALPEIFAALGLAGEVECAVTEGPAGPDGVNEVRLRMRSGPRSRWLELSDVSGGELSRVAVALERLLPSSQTLVLDEIDAGVGGQTAHQVAAQLQLLAEHSQVIVVTHLQQIAQVADRHVLVSRDGERAHATELTAAERKREIRRMRGDVPSKR